METIKISVIIPTYKPQSYIWQCLDSIYNQTMNLDEIELIIIVNGCNQPYLNDIETYIKNKHEIKTIILQTDTGGVSNARNMALDIALGEWICFIDDDDWISENYFENLICAGKDDADIVEANVSDYDEKNNLYLDDYLTLAFKRNSKISHIKLLSARSFMSSSCCKAIRRSIIGQDRFDCSFSRGEDALFMAKLSNKIKIIRTTSPDTVYYRRMRIGSASRSKISLLNRLRNNVKLAKAYIGIYLSDIQHYDFFFFSTRLLALLRNCMK